VRRRHEAAAGEISLHTALDKAVATAVNPHAAPLSVVGRAPPLLFYLFLLGRPELLHILVEVADSDLQNLYVPFRFLHPFRQLLPQDPVHLLL